MRTRISSAPTQRTLEPRAKKLSALLSPEELDQRIEDLAGQAMALLIQGRPDEALERELIACIEQRDSRRAAETEEAR